MTKELAETLEKREPNELYRTDLFAMRGDVTAETKDRKWAWLSGERGFGSPPIIAIDAAKTTGFAVLVERAHRVGHVKLEDGAARYRQLADVLHLCASFSRSMMGGQAPLVVLEDCFLHAGSPNVKTALDLKQRIGEICALAWAQGLPVVRVLPQRWQGRLYQGLSKRPKRAVGKVMALARAKSALGVDTLTEDEADAACIALWARGDL